jgi:branched-chain amino acid transport system ATP-binding protein
MPTLELSGLTVNYGQVRAVQGVDLAVESSEIFVLLGANGAGKSSLLRAVSGVIKRQGSVTWDGHDISRSPSHRIARSGLALVPEGRRIFSPLTVEENLKLGAYFQKASAQRESLERTYAMFPILGERRRGTAGLLSGGEQQMLAFGRALMAEPKMILMDEPSMGLAPAIVDVVMAKVSEIAASGIGVLMVEQNASVALAIGSQAAVLERGQITLRGTAAELRHHPEVLRAFLGEKAGKIKSGEPASE